MSQAASNPFAQGRAQERADVLAQLDEILAGVPETAKKYRAAGRGDDLNYELFATRVRMLRDLIAGGLHERLGGDHG